MYSNLSLYYLEQMGIKPWIQRQGEERKKGVYLIILLSHKPANKARVLLDKILAYTGFDKKNIITLYSENKDISPLKQLGSGETTVLLNFCTSQDSWALEHLKETKDKPLAEISSMEPEALLTHPMEKKSLFKQLNSLLEFMQ